MNGEPKFPLSSNPKDYESTANEGQDEEFPLNRELNFPVTPNPKDYESTTDEGGDE